MIFRGPDGDGLEIHIQCRTVPEVGYGNYAMGYVATVAGGAEVRHEDVLMDIADPSVLADLLTRATTSAAIDRTISLFEEGMTLRLERIDDETWNVICRPIPLPPPDASWKSFPEFSFVAGRSALERARREASVLAARLR